MRNKFNITWFQNFGLIVISLFTSILLLEIGLRFSGDLLLQRQELRNDLSLQSKETYRILCLGESTTSDAMGNNPYPRQLEQILNASDLGISFGVISEGIVDTNSAAILAELENNLNIYKPDIVVSMMGINDRDYKIQMYEEKIDESPLRMIEKLRVYKLGRLIIELAYIKMSDDNLNYLDKRSKLYQKAETYLNKAGLIQYSTHYNYNLLSEILLKRGIPLIAVQYPMMNVKDLKTMLEDNENTLFVDNEQSFEKAIEKAGYDNYFIDQFTGISGHCTAEGNRLIAENIAQTIVKEIFQTQ